jgi:hypothetical protein
MSVPVAAAPLLRHFGGGSEPVLVFELLDALPGFVQLALQDEIAAALIGKVEAKLIDDR